MWPCWISALHKLPANNVDAQLTCLYTEWWFGVSCLSVAGRNNKPLKKQNLTQQCATPDGRKLLEKKNTKTRGSGFKNWLNFDPVWRRRFQATISDTHFSSCVPKCRCLKKQTNVSLNSCLECKSRVFVATTHFFKEPPFHCVYA